MQYALTLQNNGPSDTAQMRVADLLPANFEWVAGGSYTPTAVAGAFAGLSVAAPSCSATPAAITVAGQQQTISCVLTGAFPGDSAPSNNVVLTLWARPKAGYYTGPYAADVTNTATVTPGLDGGGAPIAIDTNPRPTTAARPSRRCRPLRSAARFSKTATAAAAMVACHKPPPPSRASPA